MSKITTSWSDPREHRPAVMVDSHMVKPGEIATFKGPGATVINLGIREALIALRADGQILADVPIAPAPMTRDAATWISTNVLTRTYLKSTGGVKLVRLCACQHGQCGHCGQDDHAKCTTWVSFEGRPPAAEHTHIVGRRGAALAPVRTTGKPCRWVCSCPTCAGNHPVKKTTAYRRVTGEPRPGDTVWLTPKTLAAPAICWKQPRCTVVSVSDFHLLVDVDGQQHRIHVDNVTRSNPTGKPREPRRQPRPRPAMPDGYTEQPLF